MTEVLADKCWNTIKEMVSSYQPEQESEDEDGAMTALMRSTDVEIEKNCKVVRNAIESQRTKKGNSHKV